MRGAWARQAVSVSRRQLPTATTCSPIGVENPATPSPEKRVRRSRPTTSGNAGQRLSGFTGQGAFQSFACAMRYRYRSTRPCRSLHHLLHSRSRGAHTWALCKKERLLWHGNTGRSPAGNAHGRTHSDAHWRPRPASPWQRLGRARSPTSKVPDKQRADEAHVMAAAVSLHSRPVRAAQRAKVGFMWLWTGPRQTQPLSPAAASARALRLLIGRAQRLMPLVPTAVSYNTTCRARSPRAATQLRHALETGAAMRRPEWPHAIDRLSSLTVALHGNCVHAD
jgi:hypothetical protein